MLRLTDGALLASQKAGSWATPPPWARLTEPPFSWAGDWGPASEGHGLREVLPLMPHPDKANLQTERLWAGPGVEAFLALEASAR